LSDAELLQLQIRVIALENLVTTLLAEAPETALDLARDMAAFLKCHHGSFLNGAYGSKAPRLRPAFRN
jgi:hypothetical protein